MPPIPIGLSSKKRERVAIQGGKFLQHTPSSRPESRHLNDQIQPTKHVKRKGINRWPRVVANLIKTSCSENPVGKTLTSRKKSVDSHLLTRKQTSTSTPFFVTELFVPIVIIM